MWHMASEDACGGFVVVRRYIDSWQDQSVGNQFFIVAIIAMGVAFLGAANGLTGWTLFATLLAGILAVLAIWGLVNWCVKASTGDKAAVMGLYLLWGMPGVLMFVAGLALAVNGRGEGAPVLGIGLGLSLPLLAPFRKAMAAITPMDAESPIDWSGLALVLGGLGFLIPTAFVESTPEVVDTGSGTALVTGLLSNLVAFVVVAYLCVGYRNYRDGREATIRLGLTRPSVSTWVNGLLGVIGAFVAAFIGGTLTNILQPDKIEKLEESISALTSAVNTPAIALILALSSGIGEEVFFRGALQPRFGIVLTSLLFTFLHAQYGFTWVLLGVFGMSVVFGLLRQRYGTVAAIVAHAAYNLIVVVLQVWIL